MNYDVSKKLLFFLLLLSVPIQMLRADRVPTLKTLIYQDLIKRFKLTEPEHVEFAVMLGFPRSLKYEMKRAILGKKLVKAAKNKEWKIVEKLIKQGADVNVPDYRNGNSALMYAIEYSELTMIYFLIAQGAIINWQNKYGNTPLIDGIFYGNMKTTHTMTRILLEQGAEVNHKANDGTTALTMATRVINQGIFDLLKKYGATE